MSTRTRHTLLNFTLARDTQIGRVRLFGLSLAILGMTFSITTCVIASPAHAEAQAVALGSSDSDINNSLDSLAKLFAAAMTNKEFRHTIHDSVGQRFDGDTEVLWKTLSAKSGIQNTLAAIEVKQRGITAIDAGMAVDNLTNRIPHLQVAVPVHFETWNYADYAPRVAFVPSGVEDTTLKTVTAYDSAGKASSVDAQTGPKEPLIVLGLNERTDDSGSLLKVQKSTTSQPASSDSKASKSALAAAAAPTSYQVAMELIHLIHDREPAVKGDAEIAVKAKSKGCSALSYQDYNWTGLNNDGDYWGGGTNDYRELGHTTCDVVFYWWEDDGSSADFTLKYGDFSLAVGMDDDDDLIGGIQLGYSQFAGTSADYSEWSDLTMTTT